MNKSRQTSFNTLVLLLCLITMGAYGQKQSKTFKETFTVAHDAVLDVDTSHADIEFETWASDQVVIEAIIEIEGASEEEAQRYFEDGGFEILGNSKKVSIKTGAENTWLSGHSLGDVQTFRIEMPEFPEMDDFNFDFDFDELKNMPLPLNPMTAFDHEAFKKDGQKYLKKWQKDFQKGHDEEHIKKLEEWAERMEERREEMHERQEEMQVKREEMHQRQEEMQVKRDELHKKRAELRVERMEEREEAREKLLEAREEKREKLYEIRKNGRISNDSTSVIIIESDGDRKPSIFYSSSKGEHKNYKVKKTIKVKLPKGMKIKMNVRHGEVKLAKNTKNLNATLSHSTLWASTIDGDKTTIMASYSPVSVQQWNFGQLQANYSERVDLKEVLNIRLNATSSNVTIDRLVNTAFIENDFGPLKISSVSKDFTDLDITMQNAELDCKVPNSAFSLYVNGTSSTFVSPAGFKLDRTKNHSNTIHKGYHINNNGDRSITINSKYSKVTLQ